jgi:hypothetical protein
MSLKIIVGYIAEKFAGIWQQSWGRNPTREAVDRVRNQYVRMLERYLTSHHFFLREGNEFLF